MRMEELSGRIWIKNKTIHYKMPNGGWELPVSEIKIIGEHTDQSGPANDYFIVFLAAWGWYEASFYANGCDRLLDDLGQLLDNKLDCELLNSTDFNSRIMWPTEMRGNPLFDYSLAPKPAGIWARIKLTVLPMINVCLTDEVKRKMGW